MFQSRKISKHEHLKICKFTPLEESLSRDVKRLLSINNLQTYFPILAQYLEMYNRNGSNKKFIFQSKYTLKSLLVPSEKKKTNVDRRSC